jgi:hypothetical protein
MASPQPPAPSTDEQGEDVNRFIDGQLRKTRSHVKWVEVAGSLLVLAVVSLVYLLAMVLVDHWAVSGGLGVGGRIAALALFLAGAAFFIVRSLLPLVVRRINPVYAAQVIEQSTPSLKNSLINLLLLRSNQQQLPQVIYRGMEHQAAIDLSIVPIDSVVDRSRLIKVGYWMAAIVAIIAVYKVISPKDPIRSMERVIAPWADIDAPTRVTISEISPGDYQGFHDQRFVVKAIVKGVKSDEPVLLHYSTVDGQVVDQTLRMRIPEGDYRYSVEAPDSSTGLQQDLTYYLTAGDARSRQYHVRVLRMPSILVERVDYKYPQYTGLEPRSVDREGDLRALEGTEVTLHAKATHPIKSASVDFERDGRRDLPMTVKGRDATTQFKLTLKPKSDVPEHANYQLLFMNTDGFENPRPIEYKIDVIRDLPPEIAFLEPKPEQQVAPAKAGDPKAPIKNGAPAAPREPSLSSQGTLPMVIEASDPDFRLSRITILAERNGKPLLRDDKLLGEPTEGAKVRYFFDAKKFQLQPGDTVVYWAAAEDNKQPNPNRTETPRYTLRITSPEQKPDPNQLAQRDPPKRNPPQDQQQPNKQQPNQPNERQPNQPNQEQPNQQPNPQDGQPQDQKPNDGQQHPGQPQQPGQQQPGGDQKSGEQQNGQGNGQPNPGQQPDRRVDPNNPGEVFDKVNEHFDKKEPEKQPQQNPGQEKQDPSKQDQPKQDQQHPGQQPQQGDQKSGQQRPGEQGQGEKQQGDKQQGRDSQQARGQGEQPQNGGNSGQQQKPKNDGQQGGSEGNNSGQRSGQQTKPDQNAQGKQGGNDQSGSSGEKNAGEKSGQPSGDKPSGENGVEGSSGLREKGDPNKQGSKQGAGGEKSASEKQGGDQGQPAAEKNQGGSEQGQPGSEKGGMKKEGGPNASGRDKGAEQGLKPEQKPGSGDPKEKSAEKQAEKAGEKAGGPPDEKQLPSKSDGNGEKKPGSGGQSKDANQPEQGAKPSGDSATKPDDKGGDREMSKGNNGAGQKSDENKGTASAQEQAKPREKSGGGEQSGENKPNPDASSPSNSKNESNSKGGAEGDRSGGGKSGGGQQSDQSGTGGAGNSTSAEQGGAKSNEKGPGETSNEGGAKTPAGKAKDNAESQGEGPGSKSQPGGKQQGGEEGGGKSQKASDKPSQSKPSEGPTAVGKGNQTAGGLPDGRDVPPAKPLPPGEEPGGDDPNLDYARKATDLAIDRLKHQLEKGEPDEDLLKKLNWTRADVERFVKHWEQMKRDAQAPSPDAREQYNEALRSLGLQPRTTSLEASKNAGDKQQGLRQSRRSSPPPEYADQFRAAP